MYNNKTKNGYDIVETCHDKFGRKIIIAERKKGTFSSPDYLVGVNYDSKSGTWSQGYYDFKSAEEAKNFASKNFGIRKIEIRPVACKTTYNIGGIEIMEVNEDYVLVRDNYYGKPSKAHRSQVRYTAKGEPYFIHNGRREYLRDYMQCEYPKF